MANHPKVSAQKRARERARQERQKEKAARREEARDRKPAVTRGGSEDPDIAGIVPGPQPSPWGDEEQDDVKEDEEATE